ncbi:MAG: hypothetical protein AAGA76_00170 [Pseudomonadota bacterium]
MYNQDSFFDLSQWGQVGLVCISTTLFIVMLFAARSLLAKRAVWIKIPAALFLLWLFVWLSPQVYYMYYRMIFPDLPLQWVIWPPESPVVALQYLFFQGPHNLSAHSQGLLGWSLIVIPFVKHSAK